MSDTKWRTDEIIENQEFRFIAGVPETFGGCTLKGCSLALEAGAEVKIMLCTLVDCKFDPPIPTDGTGFGAWSGIFWYSVIDAPTSLARVTLNTAEPA